MEYKDFLGIEDLWFWFCAIMEKKQEGVIIKYDDDPKVFRVCDVLDVYKIVKALNQQGIITNKHLRVLSKWGLENKSPLMSKRAKYSDKQIWLDGLSKLEVELIKKGYLHEV